MSADINRFICSGRLSSSPDLKKIIKGDKETVTCKFNLAVNGIYSKQASFFQVTCFNKQAEFVAKFLQKGRRIMLEGALQQSRYKDENGKYCSNVGIIAQTIMACDSKHEENEIQDTAAYVSSSMDISGLEGADFYLENPNA